MILRKVSGTLAFGLLTSFAFGLVGCGGNSTLFAPGPNTIANVRVFNGLIGSSGAIGGINVRLKQTTTTPVNVSPVPFGSVSANQQTGSGNGENTYLYLNGNLTYLASQSFDYPPDSTPANSTGELLVATGVVGQTGSTFQPQIVRVQTTVPTSLIVANGVATANTLLRVINAAPGTNPISVYNAQAAIPDLSNIVFTHFSSGGRTTNNYTTLPGGTYNFTINDTASGNVLVTLGPMTLQAGVAYTLIIDGSPIPAYTPPLGVTLIQDYPLK